MRMIVQVHTQFSQKFWNYNFHLCSTSWCPELAALLAEQKLWESSCKTTSGLRIYNCDSIVHRIQTLVFTPHK
jgi:hypothetical protein